MRDRNLEPISARIFLGLFFKRIYHYIYRRYLTTTKATHNCFYKNYRTVTTHATATR